MENVAREHTPPRLQGRGQYRGVNLAVPHGCGPHANVALCTPAGAAHDKVNNRCPNKQDKN